MTRFAVERPIATVVLFLVLVVLGVMGLLRLPVDLYPDVSLPTATVVYFYPGAGPEEIEQKVLKLAEDAIASVSGVKDIRSIAYEGIGAVIVTFDFETDIDDGVNDIRANLDMLRRRFPADLEPPTIFKFDISQFPIMAITTHTDDPTVDLRDLFEKELADEFKNIPGVGEVQFWGGGRPRQVNVEISVERLEAHGLTLMDVVQALQAANLTLPAGEVTRDGIKYLVRVPADFERMENIGQVVLPGGVLLRDIARIEDGYADRTTYVRVNGKDAIFFGILKQSGANTLEVAHQVKRLLPEIEKRHPAIHFTVVNDFSRFIESSVRNLTQNVFYGAFFVVLVTLLLLRNLTGSLIISLVIPVSLIAGFLLLWLTGSSINLISLSAMAIAVGMVVDNAVVVLENIFYHRQRGESRKEAALFGTQEVGEAILASTLTTVAIFIPIVTAQGFIGVFFRELAYMVTFTLFVSLASAYMLTPALSRLFLRRPRPATTPFGRWMDTTWRRLEAAHRATLRWAARHKGVIWFIGLGMFTSSLVLFLTGKVKTEFMPAEDTGEFRVMVQLPSGTPLGVTDSVARVVEQWASEVPEMVHYATRVGPTESGFGILMGTPEGSHAAMVFIRTLPVDQRDRSIQEISQELDRKIRSLPGLVSGGVVTGNVGQQILFGASSPIEIRVFGEDMATTDSLAEEIRKILLHVPGVLNPVVSRQARQPEWRIELDRERLGRLGLVPAQVALELRTALYGREAGKLRFRGEEYPIVVRLAREDRERDDLLEGFFLRTPRGQWVPLLEVAHLRPAASPASIERLGRLRVVRVTADYTRRSLGEVVRDIQAALDTIPSLPGVRLEIAGSFERQREAFGDLFLAMILGIVLVYLVMVALFESFLMPLVVMFSVPFGIAGVAYILALTGVPMSVNAYLGMIMLVGIVVNNAIVMLDYIELLQLRGRDFLSSVVDGASRRLRPILMTTLTTIGGLIPLVVIRAEGSEAWRPLGLAVIGGLVMSTFVTLIFVPVVYLTFESIRRRFWRMLGRSSA